MGIVWYEQERAARGRGERPDMATTMAAGPLDELVALHEELGVLAGRESLRPALPSPLPLSLPPRSPISKRLGQVTNH